MSTRFSWLALPVLLVIAAPCVAQGGAKQMVIVPGEDPFSPFTMTIRSGESVEWVNNDTDDHTVVSNDAFNTAGTPMMGEITVLPGGFGH